jgi:peptidyl-dipeptidase A
MGKGMERSPHNVVRTLEDRWRDLEVEYHGAYWDSQVDATPINEKKLIESELELRRAKGDPEALTAVQSALDEGVHDPVLERQLEILRLSLTGNQMDEARRAELVELSSSVESDFSSYRPEVDGRRLNDNDIEEILKHSDDEDERRRAWEGSKEIGAVVAERVREMARLRNAVAHDLGFPDYYNMSLELQELSEEWLFETFAEVERATDEPYRRWKDDLDARLGARFGTDELQPWHYSDPFFQQLPAEGRNAHVDELLGGADAIELARKTFSAWGFDLSGVIGASDLYPREKKNQHAFCLDVDRSGNDVRILANVVPGERWVSVLLHESGHAVYDMSIDGKLPYLLRRCAHLLTTEAMALMCGRLVRNPRWLIDVAGAESVEVESVVGSLGVATIAEKLLFTRWTLAVVHFERALYADPEADLDGRWWEVVERFQLVAPPPDRAAPDWAAKIHIAAAPVYYQNYLLGELFAAQLEATCERECGGVVGVPEAGALLAERLFAPGALMRWDVLIEEATSKPLTPADFAASLNGTPD